MTKADLIANMANEAGISKVAAGKALDAFINSVSGALSKGDKVTLVGFGTFSVAERAARKGRNPQTGATINIPATNVPKFKAGAELKAACK
jgi:DNA-binding protein HU-beta